MAELRLAISPGEPLPELPFHVALKRNLFAAQRLRVTPIEFPDRGATADALTSGAAILGLMPFAETLLARVAGKQITAFALLCRSPLLVLVAKPHGDEEHRWPRDLEGDQIAVAGENDSTDLFVKYTAVQNGLALSDIETVSKGSVASCAAALENNEVAAAVLDSTHLRLLTARAGPVEVLADTRTLAGLLYTYGVSNYPASCVCADASWLSAHPEEARRLTRALLAATQWIRVHRAAEVIPSLPQAYRSSVDPAILGALVEETRPLFSIDGEFTPDGVEAAREVLAVSMGAFRDFRTPRDAYTNEFAAHRGR